MKGPSSGTPLSSLSGSRDVVARAGRLGRLAHFTARYRWPVIGAWIVLTLFGGYAAGQLSSRWYQSLAVPGKSAYEGSQRTLKALGAGVRSPNTVVFHSSRADVSKSPAVRAAMARVVKASPGALTSSYFSTGNRRMYVSHDRHTTFLQVYLPGRAGLDVKSGAVKIRAAAATGAASGLCILAVEQEPRRRERVIVIRLSEIELVPAGCEHRSRRRR